MITRIEAYRYRCFAQLAINLGEYNVLAGPNGAGKTTLLDIPTLLGDLLNQRRDIGEAFLQTQPTWPLAPRAHLLRDLIHKQRGNDFVLAIEATLPDDIAEVLYETSSAGAKKDRDKCPDCIRYELRLEDFNNSLHVSNEYLYLFPSSRRPALGAAGGLQGEPERILKSGRPKLHDPTWRSVVHRDRGNPARFCDETDTKSTPTDQRLAPNRLAFGSLSVDKTVFPAGNWFRDLLEQETVFYTPNGAELRRPSLPGQPSVLVSAASNLPWIVKNLKEEAPERFGAWIEHLQTALPIESVDVVVRQGDYHAYFVVTYDGGYAVSSPGLSEGTLRIIALTLIPYLTSTPSLLVTEEPENGIHPRAIEVVLQSLTSVYDGQVWISTHSPLVLAHTSLEHVLCCRTNDDGSVSVIQADQHPQLKQWKGEVDLGTLFAAGVLG
jgi:predicted ATPase